MPPDHHKVLLENDSRRPKQTADPATTASVNSALNRARSSLGLQKFYAQVFNWNVGAPGGPEFRTVR